MNRKIVFVDVDGTLFDVPRGMKHVSDKTKYAIKELINNGHLVFIASGRCLSLVPSELKELNPSGFLTCNGSYVSYLNKPIFKRNIKQSVINDVHDYCIKHNGVFYLEQQDKIYTDGFDSSLHKKFVLDWGVNPQVFDGNFDLTFESQLLMTAFETEEDCIEFEKYFGSKIDVRRQYGFTSFDVSEFDINKGLGVKETLKYFGINEDDAYAFGDGINDIEMIQSVTNSFAVANAIDEVKKHSRYITNDVLDDGFYNALVKEKLIKPM